MNIVEQLREANRFRENHCQDYESDRHFGWDAACDELQKIYAKEVEKQIKLALHFLGRDKGDYAIDEGDVKEACEILGKLLINK